MDSERDVIEDEEEECSYRVAINNNETPVPIAFPLRVQKEVSFCS